MQITKVDTYKHNNRILTRGVEITIAGERASRFRFVAFCTNEAGDVWIDCYGGTGWRDKKGVMSFRSFTPERIKTVHRVPKMRVTPTTKKKVK